MSRNVNAAVTSISQLANVQYRLLCEIDSLSTGMTRACTGYQFLTFAGNTYSPVGHLGGIEKIQEDADLFPRAVRLWLSAVNTSQIQDVLSENLFNRPVRIYRTFLTDSFTLVSSAEQLFRGYINTADMKLGDPQRGDFFEIEVESRLRRTPRAQYFNRETYWTVYAQSGDTFFDTLYMISVARAKWGMPVEADYANPNRPQPPRPEVDPPRQR